MCAALVLDLAVKKTRKRSPTHSSQEKKFKVLVKIDRKVFHYSTLRESEIEGRSEIRFVSLLKYFVFE